MCALCRNYTGAITASGLCTPAVRSDVVPITFGPDVFPTCCPRCVTAPRDRLPSPSLPVDDPFFRTEHVPPTSVSRVTCIAFRQPTRVRGVPRYRVTEIFYRRGDKSTETVVLFLPDTAALLPSRVAWEKQQATYRQALQAKLNPVAAAQDEKARGTRGRQLELCCVVLRVVLCCRRGRPGGGARCTGTAALPAGETW